EKDAAPAVANARVALQQRRAIFPAHMNARPGVVLNQTLADRGRPARLDDDAAPVRALNDAAKHTNRTVVKLDAAVARIAAFRRAVFERDARQQARPAILRERNARMAARRADNHRL